jgi:vacuolar-type H+-ATPase subunit H
LEEAERIAAKFERDAKNLTQDLDTAQQENRLLKVIFYMR